MANNFHSNYFYLSVIWEKNIITAMLWWLLVFSRVGRGGGLCFRVQMCCSLVVCTHRACKLGVFLCVNPDESNTHTLPVGSLHALIWETSLRPLPCLWSCDLTSHNQKMLIYGFWYFFFPCRRLSIVWSHTACAKYAVQFIDFLIQYSKPLI